MSLTTFCKGKSKLPQSGASCGLVVNVNCYFYHRLTIKAKFKKKTILQIFFIVEIGANSLYKRNQEN